MNLFALTTVLTLIIIVLLTEGANFTWAVVEVK
jgi:hypothetical protein